MVVINKIPILFLANNKLNIDIKTSEINSRLFFLKGGFSLKEKFIKIKPK